MIKIVTYVCDKKTYIKITLFSVAILSSYTQQYAHKKINNISRYLYYNLSSLLLKQLSFPSLYDVQRSYINIQNYLNTNIFYMTQRLVLFTTMGGAGSNEQPIASFLNNNNYFCIIIINIHECVKDEQ